MNIILTIIVLAVPAYMIFKIVQGYMAAPANYTTWEKLVEAFKSSASIAWARFNALSVTLIGLVGEASSYFGAPGVKEAIQPYLAPEYMTGYILIVLIGAEIARRRTLP